MNHDEDLPRRPAAPERRLLDPLAIDELEGYIAALRAEIARAEAEIVRKRAHRDAAASFFRPKP